MRKAHRFIDRENPTRFMYLDWIFAAWKPVVERALLDFKTVVPTTALKPFMHDELAEIHPGVDGSALQAHHLRHLYELRARYLDWELGTGYLGFFSPHAGTRYAFLRRIEVILNFLSSRKTSPLKVLEIGCGAGLLCLELAKRGHTVIGTDISRHVLSFANALKDQANMDNVSFPLGDAETLMFADRSFDVVICSEVLEHLMTPAKALSEIRRVLKKDGMAIMTTPCAISLSDLFMNVMRLFHKSIEAEKDIHFDKKTYLAVKRRGQDLPEATFMRIHLRFRYQDLLSLFREAGFQVQQARGTVFAFPPHSQVFYRYCPAFLLPAIHAVENGLNAIRCFQRFGSLTGCFLLKKSGTQV